MEDALIEIVEEIINDMVINGQEVSDDAVYDLLLEHEEYDPYDYDEDDVKELIASVIDDYIIDEDDYDTDEDDEDEEGDDEDDDGAEDLDEDDEY